jgi:transcriptional regulator with XRE-family HTH domain
MGNSVPYPALRAEMARAGVDQKQLAELLGYHKSAITKRMRGTVAWRLGELQAIATHLGVPISALVDEAHASAGTPAAS